MFELTRHSCFAIVLLLRLTKHLYHFQPSISFEHKSDNGELARQKFTRSNSLLSNREVHC